MAGTGSQGGGPKEENMGRSTRYESCYSNKFNEMVYDGALFGTKDDVLLGYLMGGGLDTVDGDGATPLHVACQLGHAECVWLLLALGATPDIRCKGRTPYAMAVLHQQWACAAELERLVK